MLQPRPRVAGRSPVDRKFASCREQLSISASYPARNDFTHQRAERTAVQLNIQLREVSRPRIHGGAAPPLDVLLAQSLIMHRNNRDNVQIYNSPLTGIGS